jgi:hypothetical protein
MLFALWACKYIFEQSKELFLFPNTKAHRHIEKKRVAGNVSGGKAIAVNLIFANAKRRPREK